MIDFNPFPTFDKNYCDYRNEFSRRRMHVKLISYRNLITSTNIGLFQMRT